MKRFFPTFIAILLAGLFATYIAAVAIVTLKAVKTSEAARMAVSHARDASQEKTREEAIALRIENERRTLFWTALFANLSAGMAILLALFGAWMSFRQFLQTRDRERLDRASSELNTLWQGLTSEKPEVRAASIASLQQFLTADREEYHLRVVSALALSARSSDELVTRTATAVVEYAFRNVAPDVLRSVSWRGLRLIEAKLDDANLSELDLAEAVITNASMRGATLTAAHLRGASLAGTDLSRANLGRADLAGADLRHSNLREATAVGANLTRANLLRCDLHRTDLSAAHLPSDENVRLALRWRDAVMDEEVRQRLLSRFGPAAAPPRVLMIMWEFPPFVTGGAWTASFHLVTELRRQGRDITLVVPWPQSLIDESIFGGEIEVIGVGSKELAAQKTREYFYSGYSGYGSSEPPPRIRVEREVEQLLPGTYLAPGLSLMRLVSDFRAGVAEAIREHDLQYDVVHAHDWLALEAAMPLAADGTPLIAHIHSTEKDRREQPGKRIAAIEKAACGAAAAVVVPSERTATTVQELYAPPCEVRVAGNSFGETRFVSRGQFGTGRVIFVGRMTWQKGPDLFVKIADRIRERLAWPEFFMFGDGDLMRETARQIDELRPLHGSLFNFGPADYLVEFDRVRRVSFDGHTQRIWPSPTGDLLFQDTQISRLIGGTECRIVPVQGFRTFTHRLSAGNLNFLIATDLVPTYESAGDRFVVLAGSLEWAQRHRAFDEASVVIVPSRSEPFGMVILEAMLSGVPVVCTDVAGVLQYVTGCSRFGVDEIHKAANDVTDLLTDEGLWSHVVERQRIAAEKYIASRPHLAIDALWREVARGR